MHSFVCVLLLGFDLERSTPRTPFGNSHLQESILETRPHSICIEYRLDRDLAFEGPERNFHLLQSVDGRGRRRAPHAPKPQYRSLDVHAEIFSSNARHLEADDDLIRGLEDVRRWLPTIPA